MPEIKFKINIPQVPNFLTYGEPKVGLKQDGFKVTVGNTIDVSELSEEQLREIGKEWTEALIRNSKDRAA